MDKAKRKMIIDNPQLNGQVGENAVWEGPLDVTGFPMGVGSSSGKNGLEVSKYPTEYSDQPITQLAKGRGRMVR